jgi:hypothetical protein
MSRLELSDLNHGARLRLKIVFSWISCPVKMGPIAFPETSVRNEHCTLSNTPE